MKSGFGGVWGLHAGMCEGSGVSGLWLSASS